MQTERLSAQNAADVARAAALLRDGAAVAIPTETVYGLAANALDAAAVAGVFAAKGRPQDNPLIVHIPTVAGAAALVRAFPKQARLLADAFWPGPLSMILPKSACVPSAVSAGLDTVALRVPAHPAARRVLQIAGVPLAAPSANRSGSPSPTCAAHVLADLDERIAAVLDGGDCCVGVESTVVSLAGDVPCLLRPGGITPAQLRAVLGEVQISPAVGAALAADAPVSSPGMKYAHYAPRAELTLLTGDALAFAAYARTHTLQCDALLCFLEDCPVLAPLGLPLYVYGIESDPKEQARRLFACLRQLDADGRRCVYCRAPERDGIALAVYNRLLRAAAFREIKLE
ncbi:MAG: threonylcarbamoyl-AMP synthase [Oscillospiraceae bacterium]|jgi:L-threonylcarbamoyladenylate synthase|nr:threonylcarbamoyl-AMP synthase [Oscillospiraceae bacterium]